MLPSVSEGVARVRLQTVKKEDRMAGTNVQAMQMPAVAICRVRFYKSMQKAAKSFNRSMRKTKPSLCQVGSPHTGIAKITLLHIFVYR
jgi:hypothetical protein